jgi:K+-transporting ATPase ATPase C chain
MIRKACSLFLWITLLTGVIYPLFVTWVGYTMSQKTNGSLFIVDGQVRGSSLLAQNFQTEKYFWSRPSVNKYNPLYSKGSNLGPTSRKLQQIIQKRAQELAQIHSSSIENVPSDLLYSSGSGLDPHISLKAAYFQMERVVKARHLSSQARLQLEQAIQNMTEGPQGDFWGSQYINVLHLNQFMDTHFPVGKA